MRTGVITSFKVEHIIVLCCMMLLLTELWFGAQDIDFEKSSTDYDIKNYLAGSRGSLLQRLKVCYLYVYESNPQLLLCRKLVDSRTCGLCIVCAATLLEVIIRSSVFKDLKFRQGSSDYGWSMWAIVASQTIAVLVSCFGITARLLSMATHLVIYDDTITDLFEQISGDDSWLQSDFMTLICSPFSIILDLITVLFLVGQAFEKLIKCFRNVTNVSDGACITICNEHVDEDEVEDIAERMKVLCEGDEEMDRDEQTRNLKGLVELLQRTPVSLSNFDEYQNSLMRQLRQEYKVIPIVMVVLARIATIAIPSSLSQSIYDSLEEVFDVLHFIAQGTSPKTIFSEYKHLIVAWTGTAHFMFVNKQKPEEFQSEDQLDQAIQIIKHVHENLSVAMKDFRQLKKAIAMPVLKSVKTHAGTGFRKWRTKSKSMLFDDTSSNTGHALGLMSIEGDYVSFSKAISDEVIKFE
ncbi:hypothetical protein Sjap_020552 [Stephania japonica]|uniref:Uncharacterized protein n=1 Tax=Stephania japonica TaxID=461633 RepID=A0AAP0F891_9MAGN